LIDSVRLIDKGEYALSDDTSKKIVIENEIEDRYSRLRLIPWWDQEKLRNTKVMVVGAGALGNEILKNLALLGFGQILVVDMDDIENSNLSRSVLYREENEGQSKAEISAKSIKAINPDCKVQWLKANVVYDLGIGAFRWADLVFGGLDNREARLAIMFGTVKVFIPPDTACYECTMNESDYQLLNLRRSCALLTRKDMVEGKVPTTPTIASIIAGIQVQEALKLIHSRKELPTLSGKGLFFNGLTHDSYIINYDRKEECLSHVFYENILEMSLSVHSNTLRDLLLLVRSKLGSDAIVELEKEMVYSLHCKNCNAKKPFYKLMGKITEEEAYCDRCKQICIPEMTHTIKGDETFLDYTLELLGIPEMEILIGRNGLNTINIEMTGDRAKLLGELFFI